METFDPKMKELKNKAKKAGKWFKGAGFIAVLFILAMVFGNGAFYNIGEQEQAVVTTFGIATAQTEPGLHFKIPVIQKVRKVNTTIQGFTVGYDQSDNQSIEEDSLMITGDYNFVNVDFFVEYRVFDPVKYVYASKDPVQILNNICQSCIRTEIGGYEVDAVLTTGKNEIQSTIKEMVINMLEEHDIGLQIVNVTIQDAEPPTEEVMKAFKDVETAKQGKETAINNANKYRNEKFPQAEARIDQIMQEAESTKVKRINEANAEVAKFNAMYAEYVKNPGVTRQRMFYETMEDVLPGLKVVIDGTDKTNTVLPLDSFVTDQPGESQAPQTPPPGNSAQNSGNLPESDLQPPAEDDAGQQSQ